jgi:sigma-B regulation protein RsbU (phosphoserine phosphatase)
MPIGVNVLDASGKPYFANNRAQEIFGTGIKQETAIEKIADVYQIYKSDTRQLYPADLMPVVRALRGETTSVDDLEIHQGDQTIPLENWGTPIFDENGKVTYALSAFQDITERLKREQAEQAREAAEAVNEAIMASIQYAKLIQSSLLPNMKQVKTFLPKHFVIWLPRDVVGGDMIYMESLPDGFIVAVLDCTGHGVPGAFMTMIASTNLRRIIKDEGIQNPSDILQRLNFLVKTSLQQDTEHAQSDDGLDAALCLIKPDENTLTFAGAKMPLYYIHDDQIKVIKGDRKNLGYKKSDVNFTYTTHTVTIENNMSFYLSTDGFLDQLGGSKRFSFANQRFKNILLENRHQSFEEQSKILLRSLNDYQGDNDRQDDVTVVGFGF